MPSSGASCYAHRPDHVASLAIEERVSTGELRNADRHDRLALARYSGIAYEPALKTRSHRLRRPPADAGGRRLTQLAQREGWAPHATSLFKGGTASVSSWPPEVVLFSKALCEERWMAEEPLRQSASGAERRSAFSGELVDRLGIGVDAGANANAPSSLSGRPATG